MAVNEDSIKDMVKQILRVAKPDIAKLAECSGNWPSDAEYAIVYQFTDKAFPAVSHERQVKYFNNKEKMDEWVKEQKEFVASTDNDFCATGVIYHWDLGPEVISNFSI